VIVVSNTSPIINLAAIGRLELLRALYKKVIIPQAVYDEITIKGAGQPGADEIEKSEWIEVKDVPDKNLAEAFKLELDEGEAEAIALSIGIEAKFLLMDERRGREIADRLGLTYIGILGIIIEARHKNLITSAKPLLDDLISKAGFWISKRLYTRVLQIAGESPG